MNQKPLFHILNTANVLVFYQNSQNSLIIAQFLQNLCAFSLLWKFSNDSIAWNRYLVDTVFRAWNPWFRWKCSPHVDFLLKKITNFVKTPNVIHIPQLTHQIDIIRWTASCVAFSLQSALWKHLRLKLKLRCRQLMVSRCHCSWHVDAFETIAAHLCVHPAQARLLDAIRQS